MLQLNKNENILSYILDSKNKNVGNVSYIESNSKNNTGLEEIELDENHKFQLAPRPIKEKERSVLFVAGESGSGKSYFIREYAKQYNKMFPKNSIYLISYLDQDETLDAYDKIIRLNAFSPEFLDECLSIDLEEFQDSMVIFDDIDCVVNKHSKVKIYGLLNKMLRIGRHYYTTVAFLGHELYASPELKQILN